MPMVKVMKSSNTANAHGLKPSTKPAMITRGRVNVCGSIVIKCLQATISVPSMLGFSLPPQHESQYH